MAGPRLLFRRGLQRGTCGPSPSMNRTNCDCRACVLTCDRCARLCRLGRCRRSLLASTSTAAVQLSHCLRGACCRQRRMVYSTAPACGPGGFTCLRAASRPTSEQRLLRTLPSGLSGGLPRERLQEVTSLEVHAFLRGSCRAWGLRSRARAGSSPLNQRKIRTTSECRVVCPSV